MGYKFNAITGSFDRAGEGQVGATGSVSSGVGAGSQLAPGFTFENDGNDTGIYYDASTSGLGLSSDGTRALLLKGDNTAEFSGIVNITTTFPEIHFDDGVGRTLELRCGSYDAATDTGHNPGLITTYNSSLYLGSNDVESVEITSTGAKITGQLELTDHLYVKGGGTSNKFETTANGVTVQHESGDVPFIINSGNAGGPHMRFQQGGNTKHFVGCGTGIGGLGDKDDFTIRAYDNLYLATNNTSSAQLTIASNGNATFSGNVGIGVDPASFLHIKTSTNNNLEFEEASSNLRISALNDNRDANVPLEFASSAFSFLTGGATFAGWVYGDRFINSTTSQDPWLKGVNASGTETCYIKKDGTAYFAGNIIMAADKGIQFGTTAGANHTLDDYEEGTWTPTFTAAGGGSDQWETKVGTYTKIGNMVTARFMCRNYNDAGTATLSGDITGAGLPFNNAEHFYVGDFGFHNLNSPAAGSGAAMIFLDASSSQWKLYWHKNNDNSILLNTAHLNVGSYIQGNITYRVA